jgi:hypothetical protein
LVKILGQLLWFYPGEGRDFVARPKAVPILAWKVGLTSGLALLQTNIFPHLSFSSLFNAGSSSPTVVCPPHCQVLRSRAQLRPSMEDSSGIRAVVTLFM